MSGDRDGLRERLPIETLRDGVDPGVLRERVYAFYAWALLPPSYTDDDLGADRVAAGARPSPSGSPDEYGGFDLAEWLDVDPPVDAPPPKTAPDETGAGLPASAGDESSRGPYGIPSDYRPDVDPTLVAAVALFLTAATLAVLTVGGVLPPLGPVTGMPA